MGKECQTAAHSKTTLRHWDFQEPEGPIGDFPHTMEIGNHTQSLA